MKFLIVDGYPKAAREELEAAGCTPAFLMFERMLHGRVPEAVAERFFPSDTDEVPTEADLDRYDGLLWTGCNLCLAQDGDARVERQVEISRRAFTAGVPQFGSCWAIQIGAVAAGGRVRANPKGREMGFARKIRLTESGLSHPMYDGKPPVFDGFISHLDEVIEVPAGGTVLAGNDFTGIQSLEIRHREGTFWGLQYHPEFTLRDMARLMVARRGPLVKEGFFAGDADLDAYAAALESLAADPGRKDLRWQLGLDEDILDDGVRQCEFDNWLASLRPSLARTA